jgi:hypothetical protein
VFGVTNAGGYLSSHGPRLLVGPGAATSVESLEIRLPSGRRQTLANPQIGRYPAAKGP